MKIENNLTTMPATMRDRVLRRIRGIQRKRQVREQQETEQLEFVTDELFQQLMLDVDEDLRGSKGRFTCLGWLMGLGVVRSEGFKAVTAVHGGRCKALPSTLHSLEKTGVVDWNLLRATAVH